MPVTAALLELLNAHRPESGKEAEDLERMKAYAQSLEQPFSREQPIAHFTGSALLVEVVSSRVLLLHHKKLQRWLQPGGHAEAADGGHLERTALREAQEESGCRVRLFEGAPRPFDVDVHSIPARPEAAGHFHLDVRFLLVAENPEALAYDAQESEGARWLEFEQALEWADDVSLKRLLRKGREFLSGRGAR